MTFKRNFDISSIYLEVSLNLQTLVAMETAKDILDMLP